MAVTYSTALKTTRLTAVRDAIDAGAGAGYIEICSAAYALVLATITLNDPCGTVFGDVLTFDISPQPEDASADATGTAAIARIKDSDGNIAVSGLTVGTTGADLIVTSTAFVATDPIVLSSATIAHA